MAAVISSFKCRVSSDLWWNMILPLCHVSFTFYCPYLLLCLSFYLSVSSPSLSLSFSLSFSFSLSLSFFLSFSLPSSLPSNLDPGLVWRWRKQDYCICGAFCDPHYPNRQCNCRCLAGVYASLCVTFKMWTNKGTERERERERGRERERTC